MKEYIEREAIEIALNHRLNFLMAENGEYDHYTSGFDEAVTMVENFPSADVEPVQEWIPVTDETKPKCPCLVIDVHGNLPRVAYQMLHYTSERFGYFCCDRDFEQMATDIYTKKKVGVDNAVMVAHGNRIAYWMPLPPLPKGE